MDYKYPGKSNDMIEGFNYKYAILFMIANTIVIITLFMGG